MGDAEQQDQPSAPPPAPPDPTPLPPGWLAIWLLRLPDHLSGFGHAEWERAEHRQALASLEIQATPLLAPEDVRALGRADPCLAPLLVLRSALRHGREGTWWAWAVLLVKALREGCPPLLAAVDALAPLGPVELRLFLRVLAPAALAEGGALQGWTVVRITEAAGVRGEALQAAMTALWTARLLTLSDVTWRLTPTGETLARALEHEPASDPPGGKPPAA